MQKIGIAELSSKHLAQLNDGRPPIEELEADKVRHSKRLRKLKRDWNAANAIELKEPYLHQKATTHAKRCCSIQKNMKRVEHDLEVIEQRMRDLKYRRDERLQEHARERKSLNREHLDLFTKLQHHGEKSTLPPRHHLSQVTHLRTTPMEQLRERENELGRSVLMVGKACVVRVRVVFSLVGTSIEKLRRGT
jgi:chromosome segregation ATPase